MWFTNGMFGQRLPSLFYFVLPKQKRVENLFERFNLPRQRSKASESTIGNQAA